MDTNELVTKLAAETAEKAVALADVTRLTAEKDGLATQLSTANDKVTQLEADLAAAKEAKPEDYDSDKAELSEARALLGSQFNALRVANGEEALDEDKLPKKVADFKTGIDDMTGKLTALLPTDGVARGAGNGKEDSKKADFSGFKTNK